MTSPGSMPALPAGEPSMGEMMTRPRLALLDVDADAVDLLVALGLLLELAVLLRDP